VQNKAFLTNKTLNLGGRLVSLEKPAIMGILNVTPDSFFDGNRYTNEKEILLQVEKMLFQGATFVDVGGYSSRPGAEEIPIEEEQQRVLGAIRPIIKRFPEILLSIDTFRSEVAKVAVGEGAMMINDISGGSLDSAMFQTISQLQVPYILMHMRGNPQTMTSQADYQNLTRELMDYFHQKINQLIEYNLSDIIIDPGFGFAKTIAQNFELLNHLDYFNRLERPLLVGLSRKSMIWKTLQTTPDEALNGSTSLHTIALLKGANILRVHDVKEAQEVITLLDKLSIR
jgi:dihydropteroate synthase